MIKKTIKISDKTRAILVGIFILTAYSMLLGLATDSKLIVMSVDVISGLSVIAISILMFPLFKKINKPASIAYLISKFIEGGIMVIAGLLFLNNSLQSMRSEIYEGAQLHAFIISSFIFYYLLYKSELVPRFISIWGALGIFTLLVSTALKIADMSYPMIDYLLILIITNEIFLAFWLMIKGFDKRKIKN